MMHYKKNTLFLILLFLLLLGKELNVLAGSQDVSAIRAMQMFDSGNFAEAEIFFRVLLDEDPGNPMLNYYYGASRTENKHFGDNELACLRKAGTNITPDRLHYYFGIQYHARSDWEQALKYYNQFKLSVPEKEQELLQLAQKIQQCFDHVNPYQQSLLNTTAETMEKEAEESGETVGEEMKESEETFTEKPKELTITTAEESKMAVAAERGGESGEEGIPVTEYEPGKPEQGQRTTGEAEEDVPEPQVETPDAENIHEHAMMIKAGEPADEKSFTFERELLPDLPGVEPTYPVPAGDPVEFRLNHQITYLFSSQFQTLEGKELFEKGRLLQHKMDDLLKEADILRSQYEKTSDPVERIAIGEKILSHESEVYDLQKEINRVFSSSRDHENDYWNQTDPVVKHNFIIGLEKIKAGLEKKSEKDYPKEQRRDTVPILLPGRITEVYETSSDIPAAQKAGQLVYKIQIGAYSRGIPSYRKRLFNKLSLIRKIDQHTDESGVTVYTTGNLNNPEDAKILLSQLKQEGIEDAFIVPFFNGKRITLEQAKKMEAGNDIKTD
jgi:tetratricopeptide (TPR) repeat protein